MQDQSEDELLGEALGALAGPGRRGAKSAARLLKKDVYQIDLVLPLSLDVAVERVRGALAEVGRQVNPARLETSADRTTLRVIAGGGFGGLNPVVVTVVLASGGADSTSVHLRAAAKEGLIKQHAAEKTAKRIAALLAK